MTSLLPRSARIRMAVPQKDVGGFEGVSIRRFAAWDDALPFAKNWNTLAEDCGGDAFNTYEWCATWWRHFGHRRALTIYAAFFRNSLVGVWPLFRETLHWGPLRLRVIRIVGSDHGITTCNVLTHPQYVGVVAPAMLEAIESDGDWDVLHFGELPGYAENVALLAEALHKSPFAGAVRIDEDTYPHAVFDVPAEYDQYLANLSLKERRNLRRDERELASAGGTTVEPGSAIELAQAFDHLINLHSTHWRRRGREGHFGDFSGIEEFYRDIAEQCRNFSTLTFIEISDQLRVTASEFAIRFRNRIHWIIGGRQEDVSSRVGFAALMRAAIRDGASMIDALPGEYDYKRRLGARSLGVKSIWVLPQGRRGAIRLVITQAIVKALSLVYHRMWFWHLAPWCHKRMPHLARLVVRPGLWERFARSRFLVVNHRKGHRVSAQGSGSA